MKLKSPVVVTLAMCLVVGALLLVAASQSVAQDSTRLADDESSSAGTAVASPEGSPAASPVPVGSPQSASGVTIVMGKPNEVSFDPAEMTIAANTDVVVTLINEGQLEHDFHIRELVIATSDLEPGDSATVTINAPPGEYEFYCDVLDHRDVGMVGTLTIE